jgi:hypothetical protein
MRYCCSNDVLPFIANDCLLQQSTTETAAPVASIPTTVDSTSTTTASDDTSGIDTSIDGCTLTTPVADVQLHAGDAIANQQRYLNFTYNINTHCICLYRKKYPRILHCIITVLGSNSVSEGLRMSRFTCIDYH